MLDECRVVTESLSREVKDLISHEGSSNSTALGTGSAKRGWNAAAMEERQSVLSVQGQALKLLLTASQWYVSLPKL